MDVGPLGASLASSLSATNLAQRNSSDVTNAKQATASHALKVDSTEQAEKAAGIGDAEESEKAGDRDADGRRLWERQGKPDDESDSAEAELEGDATYAADPQKDVSGVKGRELDISG